MASLAGKRLLIMHGTHIAAEIVRAAQQMGITTIVADYNPVDKAPAKQIADEHYEVSLLDVDAVVALVEEQRIDGVMAGFSDLLLPYYAQVCNRTGLPAYGTEAQFHILTDKQQYKALFEEYGIPTITGYSIEEFDEDRPEHVEFPVIVKPAEGSGSRGITICHDAAEVRLAAAKANTTFFGDGVIIERFLEGEEATAFWVFQDGGAHLSALANRHTTVYEGATTPLPFAYSMPSVHLPRYEAEISPKLKVLFSDLGIRDGMMFIQGKIDEGTFRAYDIGYRLTGTQEYHLLDALGGYNPLEMLIRFSLTGSMGEADLSAKATPRSGQYGYNVSIAMEPGKVGRFEGLEEIAELPGVVSVLKAREEGHSLAPDARGQLLQIAVRVQGTAISPAQAVARISRIRELCRVIGTDGEDLTLRAPRSLKPEVFL